MLIYTTPASAFLGGESKMRMGGQVDKVCARKPVQLLTGTTFSRWGQATGC